MGFIGNLLGVSNPTYSRSGMSQLEDLAAGRGPSPAAAMYQKQAEDIGNREAGLMRSARGISPGTAARTAGEMGAEAMRQASAGSAIMQQQQQLDAQRRLAELSAAAARQNTGIEGQLVGGIMQGAGGVLAGPLGAWAGRALAPAVTGGYGGDTASGGDWYMQHAGAGMADGGTVQPPEKPVERPLPDVAPPWYEGETAKKEHAQKAAEEAAPVEAAPTTHKATGGTISMYDYLGLNKPAHLARGGMPVFMSDGTVPGKAEVAGDSEKNDVVDAKLSPGEIVIPRSIAKSPNAPEEAAAFVAHLMRRQGNGYAGVLKARGKMADGGEVDSGAEEPAPKEAAPETGGNAAERFVRHLSKLMGVKEPGVIQKRKNLYKEVEEQTKDE